MPSVISSLIEHTILQHLNEAIIVFDPYANRIIDVNPALCRLLNYSSEALRDQQVTDLFISEYAALILFTQAVLDKGSGWTDELVLRTHGDKPLEVELFASNILHQHDVCITAIVHDKYRLQLLHERAEANLLVRRGITEWKRIEKIFTDMERENQLLLEAVGEGIYGVNAEGKTTFVNSAAERILGWTAEELVGRKIHPIMHHTHPDGSHYPSQDCPIYAAFHDGVVHRIENEVFWHKDGTPIPIEYVSTPVVDHGQLVGAVVVFRDVSERKQAEEKLHAALREVEELKQRLELENAYLQEEIRTGHNYKEIVGGSTAIQRLINQIDLVAATDANVLITGESGTGKELIARAIHGASQRCERPLIRVNCAAIPRDLFESEFFGHIRGAFTGATTDRTGRFELADGGTLFLDEVGEIPLELQSKLLRVLQESQFEKVGESKTRKVDVRIIAATNRNLQEMVQNKQFREDLYFRLNVFPIDSVPLRSRIEDIPLLVTHFLNYACEKFNKHGLVLSKGDMKILTAYDWPGNIRELQNVIERAVILSRGNRLTLDLPQSENDDINSESIHTTVSGEMVMTRQSIHEMERNNIINALKLSGGKIFGEDGAAIMLGLKPTTLASRIKRLGINKQIVKSAKSSAQLGK
ncbi:sigma 54-interacting transcriptional regulator [Kaarinaea lacus]